MLEYYGQKPNYSFVAQKLNEIGAKTQRGNSFRAESVKRILNAPARENKIVYGGVYAPLN